jgi:hypothetical protein
MYKNRATHGSHSNVKCIGTSREFTSITDKYKNKISLVRILFEKNINYQM